MKVTHLVTEPVDTNLAGIHLPVEVVYCGADTVLHCSRTEESDEDGWCTVDFMFRDYSEFENVYSGIPLCPKCLEHPDVALLMLREV